MKYISALIVLFFSITLVAEAQLRKDLHQSEGYTATVSHYDDNHSNTRIGDWMNLLNMTMGHSYSVTFNNIGGQMQNLNAYTNHMYFDISDRMNAQLDVSLLHSPFGNSFMGNDNFGAQIIVEQARIDYRLSPNAHISLQFSQRPSYYGFGPYGARGNYSPLHHRMSSWY